jgi:TldD protein
MTNVYIEAGDTSLKELLEGWSGIYLVGSRGGSVDTAQGLFQFNAQRAYNVEKGRITKHLRDVSLSGRTLDLLAGIDGIGEDLEFHSGRCGKQGQGLAVGDGSPHLRVKNAMVGGAL